jgi:CheY-like chemotaxis protein
MPRSAHDIAARIPFLRRYARALTGSQAIGDQYVRICLEMIVETPELLPDGGDLQRELFCLFHRVWTRTSPAAAMGPAGRRPAAGLANELGELPAIDRQVLLLVAVERYAFDDVGYILSIREEQARAHFNQALEEISRYSDVPIMIIEDEKIIALDLKSIVEEMGHNVCGMAQREGEAIDVAAQTRPQLILADIELKDGGNGIVAVRKILQNTDVPVIFITAYPEYLLTGNAPEPTFIITKPFNRDTIKAAIAQALFVKDKDRPISTLARA